MHSTPEFATVDAWLEWFATYQQAACRAYLCTRYTLNPLDAEALINTACLQVFRHWATITQPLTYFRRTLRQAVAKQGQRRSRERRQLEAYAQQYRLQAHSAGRPVQQVTDLLERVSLRQRRILEWFIHGYDDAQVASWLETTPQAVRMARYSAYCVLRAQSRLPQGESSDYPCPAGGEKIF
jgi:DNA-directed RNA polymerase specialized sigma24 family protein